MTNHQVPHSRFYVKVLTVLILSFILIVDNGTSSTLPEKPPDDKGMAQKKVIIVGAGVSGIAAASRLLQNGMQDVTVLEGMDRIGGRVHYKHLENGKGGVDLGGHWIHGEGGNKVYELAQPLGLVNHSGDYENLQFFFPGGRELNFVDNNYDDLFEDLLSGNSIDKLSEDELNQTYEEYVHAKADKIMASLNISKSDKEAMKFHIIRTLCILESCGNIADVSLKQANNYEELDGDRLMEWINGGMNNIIDLLTGKHEKSPWKGLDVESKVKLSTKVTKIDWSADQVKVSTDKGDELTADFVIFTPSLSVLKYTHKRLFNPPLPEEKVSVIEKLGMDVVDKIYLVFDKPWWPTNGVSFSLLHEDVYPIKTQDWGEDIISFTAEHHNPNILCAWIIGEAAKEMERESVDRVKTVTMRVLRRYLPSSYNIPDPIEVVRSRWWSNEFVRGSYSFAHKDSDQLEHPRETLEKPLNNAQGKSVVLFAGEATNAIHYSSIHGALETGWREADRILLNTKS